MSLRQGYISFVQQPVGKGCQFLPSVDTYASFQVTGALVTLEYSLSVYPFCVETRARAKDNVFGVTIIFVGYELNKLSLNPER